MRSSLSSLAVILMVTGCGYKGPLYLPKPAVQKPPTSVTPATSVEPVTPLAPGAPGIPATPGTPALSSTPAGPQQDDTRQGDPAGKK